MSVKRAGKIVGIVVALAITLPMFSSTIYGNAVKNEEPVTDDTETGSKEKTIVRVGCLNYPGFTEQTEDGAVTGYGADYLNEMAKYEDFSYEYVFADWASQKKMLLDHDVDIIFTRRNDDLPYCYSEEPFTATLTALYAREDDSDFYYDDYKRLNGSDIGFIKDSFHDDYFREYASSRGFVYTCKYYDSLEELKEAVVEGKIDAMATDSMSDHEGLKCVGSYGTETIYAVSWEGNPLIDRINYAMNEISSQDITYRSNLFKEYFQPEKSIFESTLTREEAAYVLECPTLKVAFNSDIRPMAYKDPETGETVGITPSILQLIEEKTGLKFEYMPLPGADEEYAYDYFRQNDVDLIASIEVNKFNENVPELILTDSYFSATKVLVGRTGESISEEGDSRIAIVGGSATLPYVIAERFPNYEIVTYDNIEACLDAVENGEADVLLYNQYLIEQYLKRPQYEKLTIIPKIEVEEKNAISPVSYPDNKEKNELLSDPRLVSILNKAINEITEDEVNSIVIRYAVEQDTSWSIADFCYEFQYPIMIGIILTTIVIILLIVIASVRQKNFKMVAEKNGQLASAIDIAQNASNTKSQFLAQMSHEIRTPMNAIIGMTYLAEKVDGNPDQTKKYLGKIDTSSKLLLSIINDVLDMSAIESNKLKIANSQFDLNELLLPISEVYGEQCRQKQIAFEITVSDKVDTVLLGDSLRVSQILMNLISNAYKFTPEGGKIRLEITRKAIKDGIEYLRFVVEDTGCGIAEDRVGSIFNVFEQENAEVARKYGGSGLGLAITKNLTELMHGTIKVSSEVGSGSVFTVDLPFDMPEGRRMASEKIHRKSEKEYDFEGRRVLLVEDYELNREVAEDILNEVHIKTDMAEDGLEAVEKFEDSEPGTYDIILMDIQMPVLNGLEAAKRIRESKHPEAKTIPIYAMTANAFTEDVTAVLSAGMNGHIAKPIDTAALYETLDKVWNSLESQRQ